MVLFKASFIHLLVLRPWPTLWPTLWPTGGQILKNINTTLGVVNGAWKIQGLDKFCSNFEISKAFSMSLEISFSCDFLGLGFSNFWLRGSRSLGFCFLAHGFDQNHEKIVYLIKNVR